MKKKLPVLNSPSIVLELPVSKTKVVYRPFVISEEKALLLAQESNDKDTILQTMKDVIQSCSKEDIDFDVMPVADFIYLFLQFRISSVGNDIRFRIKCQSCDHENIIAMNLSDVKVKNVDYDGYIKITDSIGIKVKVPSINYSTENISDDSKFYELLEYVYDEDTVYTKEEYTKDDFYAWLDTMNKEQLDKLRNSLSMMPKVSHSLDFNCTGCGEKNSRLLEGLHSFFRFGPSK